MEDFRKYAVKHLGLNSQVLNDVVSPDAKLRVCI